MTATDRIGLLREAGTLMFGARWQRATARLLGVSSSAVQSWVTGERSITDETLKRLTQAMCDEADDRRIGALEIERAAAKIVVCRMLPQEVL